jgi:hypothetical protein
LSPSQLKQPDHIATFSPGCYGKTCRNASLYAKAYDCYSIVYQYVAIVRVRALWCQNSTIARPWSALALISLAQEFLMGRKLEGPKKWVFWIFSG